ncbi:serpin-ZX-like [Pyrus ussuriensis x Pyrus communis]|uniref:Serpin-ZX-like n=1 Tax=Pyrus ussuriensis x Pyrus communis TaxID=2448454 RepID=A0A5N5GP92_9ROSA|nr:serpin-ZX-like [Pyrus ussuriensis x Pyrus communis]
METNMLYIRLVSSVHNLFERRFDRERLLNPKAYKTDSKIQRRQQTEAAESETTASGVVAAGKLIEFQFPKARFQYGVPNAKFQDSKLKAGFYDSDMKPAF